MYKTPRPFWRTHRFHSITCLCTKVIVTFKFSLAEISLLCCFFLLSSNRNTVSVCLLLMDGAGQTGHAHTVDEGGRSRLDAIVGISELRVGAEIQFFVSTFKSSDKDWFHFLFRRKYFKQKPQFVLTLHTHLLYAAEWGRRRRGSLALTEGYFGRRALVRVRKGRKIV